MTLQRRMRRCFRWAVVLFLPLSAYGASDFDALFNAVEKEKKEQWRIYDGEIKRIDERFEALWQKRKAEIEKKWDQALRSTNKEWVEYDPSLDAVSYVNFKEGFVEISAVVPVGETEIDLKAKELIAQRITAVLSGNNQSGRSVLADQIRLAPGKAVTYDNLALFVEKTTQNVRVLKKPFVPKDGKTRKKAVVRFDLLPDHLEIRAKKFHGLTEQYSRQFHVLPQLVTAVIHTESYFNPLAVSPADAHGLMQLIPKYGARDAYNRVYKKDKIVSPDYLYVPKNNIELGAAYLSILDKNTFKSTQDDLKRRYLVICSYNWGPGSIRRKVVKKHHIDQMTASELYQTLRRSVPKETSDYLERVTKRMKLYENIF